MKLKKLESRVAALLALRPTPPTLEEFKSKWKNMDELDKSIYIGLAECPALFGVDLDENKVLAAICEYLMEMGLAKGHIDLQTLIDGLETADEDR